MGDFNAKPNSKAVRIMRENLPGYQNVQLQDVYDFLDSVIGNTYHGFKGKIKQKFKPIDYIFVSDDFEIVRPRWIPPATTAPTPPTTTRQRDAVPKILEEKNRALRPCFFCGRGIVGQERL